MLKKIVKLILPTVIVEKLLRCSKQIANFYSLSIKYGQWKTIRDWSSVDEVNKPIPWYTYPATEYLSHLNFTRMNILEYGSGNSTLWWSKRALRVLAIEDNKDWFTKITSSLKRCGVEYVLKTDKMDYVESATSANDVLIIDGQFRRECAEHVVKVGKSAAMIIFDNSDWYPSTIEFLQKSLNWIQVDFHGFGPINGYTWTTSMFINPVRHNELERLQKLASKCGLSNVAAQDF
jgi:hypothetical protein